MSKKGNRRTKANTTTTTSNQVNYSTGIIKGPHDNLPYKIVTNVDDILQQADLNEGRIAISPGVILKTAAMGQQLAAVDKSKQQLTDSYVQAVLGPNVVCNFENPYDTFMQWSQHDCYRRDGEINRAVTLKAQFCLGDNVKTNLDVNRTYATEEQNKRALSLVSSEPQYQVYKSDIDTINQRVQFTDKMLGCLVTAQVYGRGVLQIDYDEDGLPIRLKPLNPMRIGRLFHDKDTWEVRGIEYLDYSAEKGQTLIKSENMIYIPNKNFHVSPNTYQHGYSDLETIVDVSETNRIMNEIDMKEAARRSWAPYILVKFKRRNAKVMKDFINKFKEGRTTATAEDVEVTVHEIPLSTDKLAMLRDMNEKKIVAVIGVPTFLLGREDVTNRATAQSVLQAFDQSVIKQLRNWIKLQIEDQWIKPMLLRLKQIKETVTGVIDEDILTPESLNPLPSTTSAASSAEVKSKTLPPGKTTNNLAANQPAANTLNAIPEKPKPFPAAQAGVNPLLVSTPETQKIIDEQQRQQEELQAQQEKEQLAQRNKALNAFSAIEWQRTKRKQERMPQQQETEATPNNRSSEFSTTSNEPPPLINGNGNGGNNSKKTPTIFPVDAEGDIESEEEDNAELEGLPLGYYAEDLEFKIKVEFPPISFDLPSDLGPVVVQLKNSGIIDNIAALEMLHLDKYIERTQLAEAQKAAEDSLYSEMMLAEQSAMAKQQMEMGQNPQPPQFAQAAKDKGMKNPMIRAQQARVKAMAQSGMINS